MSELIGERVREVPARSLLRPVLALLGAVFGALAAVGAVWLLMTDRSFVVHANRFVNPAGLVDANNSPTVVQNPTDPDNLVVVNRIDRPSFAATLHYSVDGGQVWRSNALPLPDGLDRVYAPDAAFADDGTVYVTYANLTGPGNVPQNLWLARSGDGGRTLSEPSRVAGELSFQARLVVSPDGTIHVTYLQATDVGTLQLAGPAPIVAVASGDGGRTWTEPVQVSDAQRARVGAATPVVDSHGDLVVLYQDFKGDVRDFQNLQGPAWPEPFGLVVTRSTDGGATFTSGVEIESGVVPTDRFLVFLPPFPSIAAGPDRSLAVGWSDARNGDADVFLRRSPDGERWTESVRVNDNPQGDGTSQYLPVVDVAADGRVDVLFYDRRRDPNDVMTDTFLATTVGADTTFTNVQVSSASSDSRVGPQAAPHLPVDAGSRLGLVSADRSAHGVWADTRLGSEATGRQDVVAAQVDLPRPARAQMLLVAAGLAVALLALAGWWWTGRRALRRG